jgi:hypothetical protein
MENMHILISILYALISNGKRPVVPVADSAHDTALPIYLLVCRTLLL